MNHNRHFSEWLAESDYDYAMAHESCIISWRRGGIYEKFWCLKQEMGKVRWGRRTFPISLYISLSFPSF